MESEGF
ncbi:unnamed protein product [Callosobruchus maculatus]|nr:unnamed protein product [Callosobruchus maculatus]